MEKNSLSKKRVGIIGSGFGKYVILESLKKIKRIKSVSICSRDKKKLIELKKKNFFIIKDFYTNFSEMLKKNKFDLLIVCTLPEVQFDILKYKHLHKNKKILIEKPMANNFKNAKKVYKLIEKKNNFYADLIFLELKIFQKLKNIILKKKSLIKNIKINWSFLAHHNKYNLKNWKQDTNKGGGIFWNYIIHIFSYILFFFPKIKECNLTRLTKNSCKIEGKINNLVNFVINFDSNSFTNDHSIKVFCDNEIISLQNRSADYVNNFKLFSLKKNKTKLIQKENLNKNYIKIDNRVFLLKNKINKILSGKKDNSIDLLYNSSLIINKLLKNGKFKISRRK